MQVVTEMASVGVVDLVQIRRTMKLSDEDIEKIASAVAGKLAYLIPYTPPSYPGPYWSSPFFSVGVDTNTTSKGIANPQQSTYWVNAIGEVEVGN